MENKEYKIGDLCEKCSRKVVEECLMHGPFCQACNDGDCPACKREIIDEKIKLNSQENV